MPTTGELHDHEDRLRMSMVASTGSTGNLRSDPGTAQDPVRGRVRVGRLRADEDLTGRVLSERIPPCARLKISHSTSSRTLNPTSREPEGYSEPTRRSGRCLGPPPRPHGSW